MPEILKAGNVVKGTTFLDSVLSKETFNTLDQHAHTLDQVTTLMDKANKLLGNPLLSQIVEIANTTRQSKVPTSNDGWNSPTMSELSGGGQQRAPPAPIQPVTQYAQVPDRAVQEPSRAAQEPSRAVQEVSELHKQVKDEIDKLKEDDLMDLMIKMSSDPEIQKKVDEVKKEKPGKPGKEEVKEDEN